jgi:ribosomal protein S18 acetylase RimI-like enzyme
MTELKYDYAKKSDISELVRLRIAYIKSDQGEINDDDLISMTKQLSPYFKKHLNNDLIAFVARTEDRIVSTALLLIVEKPANPHFINGRVGEVLNVYTEEVYRNQGIATVLMRTLVEYATNNCLDRVDLSATNDGYSLYKKIGFVDSESSYKKMLYLIEK